VDRPLDSTTAELIQGLCTTRRMRRNVSLIGLDPGLYSSEGEFYISPDLAQEQDDSILDYNSPPFTQPGLWCKWTYNPAECCIEWDGREKFYGYFFWLWYLVKRILAPKRYMLTGVVFWEGEFEEDRGALAVIENNFRVYFPMVKNEDATADCWHMSFFSCGTICELPPEDAQRQKTIIADARLAYQQAQEIIPEGNWAEFKHVVALHEVKRYERGYRIWTPETHGLFPMDEACRIGTVMLLWSSSSCALSEFPAEILFCVLGSAVASRFIP